MEKKDKNSSKTSSENIDTKPKKDKATSGGGKDTNEGGRPAQQGTAGGKGNTSGSRGTQGS